MKRTYSIKSRLRRLVTAISALLAVLLVSALLMAQVVDWVFAPINRLTKKLAQKPMFSQNDLIGASHD